MNFSTNHFTHAKKAKLISKSSFNLRDSERKEADNSWKKMLGSLGSVRKQAAMMFTALRLIRIMTSRENDNSYISSAHGIRESSTGWFCKGALVLPLFLDLHMTLLKHWMRKISLMQNITARHLTLYHFIDC